MGIFWSPVSRPGYRRTAAAVLVCLVSASLSPAAAPPECSTAEGVVTGEIATADGSKPACDKVELWAIPEKGAWLPLGAHRWGAIALPLGPGDWRIAAHGCGTYFPFYPSARVRCARTPSGCVACAGLVQIKMYGLFGSYRGRVTRLPEGTPAGAGVSVSAAADGCSAERYAATDAAGRYSFDTTLEPHRSNHWSLLLDGDGSGAGTRTYFLNADTCDNAVPVATFSSAEVNADLYQMAPYMATADPSMRLPPFPRAARVVPSGDVALGVHPTTGNLALDQTDVRGGEPDGFHLARSYNSRTPVAGALGPGWTHSYDAEVSVPSPGVLMLRRGDGGFVYFEDMDGDRTFRPSVPIWEESLVQKTASGYLRRISGKGEEVYDSGGRLTKVSSASGRATALIRDRGGRLTAVTDADGRRLRLDYRAADGRLTRVYTPSATVVSYDYDDGGRLERVTYPDGTGWAFGYGEGPALTSVADLTGRVLRRYAYAGRRVSSAEIGDGQERRTFRYAPLRASMTDALGRATEIEWTNLRGVRSVTAVSGPCAACDVVGPEWDPLPAWPGSRWIKDLLPVPLLPWRAVVASREGDRIQESRSWAYDADGRVIAYRDAAGARTTYGYGGRRITSVTDPLERISRFAYDTAGRLTSVERPSRVAPDSRRTMRLEYDTGGRIVARTESGLLAGREPFSRVTRFAYDAAGRLAAVDGPRADAADTVTFSYLASGGLASVSLSPEVVVRARAYDELGHPGSVTTPELHVVPYAFDSRGRLRSRGAPGQRTLYEYSPSGRLARVTLPRGNEWTYLYDAYDRLVTARDGSGRARAWRYDVMGRRLEERLVDASGKSERRFGFESDPFGRITRVTTPDGVGSERRFDPAGRVTLFRSMASAAEPTLYSYDAAGRLVTRQSPGALPVSYRYDAADGLTAVHTAPGPTLSFVRDDTGSVVRQTSPEAGTSRFAYDAAGGLVRETRANGVVIAYERDGLGRVVRVRPSRDRPTTFRYDTCANGQGRLCEVTDASGLTRYAYDGLGRLEEEERVVGSARFVVGYGYDADGVRSSLRSPTGRTFVFTRNGAGEEEGVATGSTPLATNAAYAAEGGLVSLLYGNGVGLLASHDSRGRLTAARVGRTLHQTVAYDDLTGGPSAIADALDAGRNQTFSYTDGRLSAASGPWGVVTWSYDPIAGRVAEVAPEGSTTYSYEPGTQRLASSSGTVSAAFEHDATGNVVGAGSRAYIYDDAGRLVEARSSGAWVARFAYDFKGRRAWKATPEATILYHYDAGDRLIAETTAEGRALVEYAYLGALPIATYRAGDLRYLHADLRGAPLFASDADGRRTWDAGPRRPFDDGARPARAVGPEIRGLGEYDDVETGLVHNGTRYYDPRLGRYLETLAPCEAIPGGRSSGQAYAYAANRPLSFVAPSGRGLVPAGAAWGSAPSSAWLLPPAEPAIDAPGCAGDRASLPSPRLGPGLWEWADPTRAFDLVP